MNWMEIFMDSLPHLVSILAVIVAAILGYFKIAKWEAAKIEAVISKIINAIFDTELKTSRMSGVTSEDKLKMATDMAVDTMSNAQVKVMKKLGSNYSKDNKSNPFLNAVQGIFTNSAQNLLEYGVKKGVKKITKGK